MNCSSTSNRPIRDKCIIHHAMYVIRVVRMIGNACIYMYTTEPGSTEELACITRYDIPLINLPNHDITIMMLCTYISRYTTSGVN